MKKCVEIPYEPYEPIEKQVIEQPAITEISLEQFLTGQLSIKERFSIKEHLVPQSQAEAMEILPLLAAEAILDIATGSVETESFCLSLQEGVAPGAL